MPNRFKAASCLRPGNGFQVVNLSDSIEGKASGNHSDGAAERADGGVQLRVSCLTMPTQATNAEGPAVIPAKGVVTQ